MRIVISGNIGSGKTTQMSVLKELLKTYDNMELITEAVDEWLQEGWLQNFYQNPEKWSFSFQLRVLLSQIQVPKEDKEKILIIERSPQTTQMIFGQQLYEDGHIHIMEHELLNRYAFEMGWIPDIFIYIKTEPEVCHQRVKERSRETENLIPLEYLKKLHDKHESLHQSTAKYTYFVDGNRDKDDVTRDIILILEKIHEKSKKS